MHAQRLSLDEIVRKTKDSDLVGISSVTHDINQISTSVSHWWCIGQEILSTTDNMIILEDIIHAFRQHGLEIISEK